MLCFLLISVLAIVYQQINFSIFFEFAINSKIPDHISYQFGGLVLDAFTVRAILYAVLTAVMFPLARLGFKKHQVT